jgi:hypothetical protein
MVIISLLFPIVVENLPLYISIPEASLPIAVNAHSPAVSTSFTDPVVEDPVTELFVLLLVAITS